MLVTQYYVRDSLMCMELTWLMHALTLLHARITFLWTIPPLCIKCSICLHVL